jgi:hypothetical protein
MGNNQSNGNEITLLNRYKSLNLFSDVVDGIVVSNIHYDSDLKIRNDVLNNLKNLPFLEEKYPNKMANLYNENLMTNLLNDHDCYFLLIFPQTRKYLINTNFKFILLETDIGFETLLNEENIDISSNNAEIFFSTLSEKKKILILKSKFKNILCDTEELREWAFNHSDESRKVLVENEKIRHLLKNIKKTEETRKFLIKNKYYDLFEQDEQLYLYYFDNKKSFYITKTIIDKFTQDSKIKALINRDKKKLNFGYAPTEKKFTDHGYDNDGYLVGPGHFDNECCGNYHFFMAVLVDGKNEYKEIYQEILKEFSKHKCYYKLLFKHNIYNFMFENMDGCLFLALQNNVEINNKLLETENGRNALLTTENGRNLLLQNDTYRMHLMNCNEGIKLLMKNHSDLVYKYKQLNTCYS